MNEKTIWFGYNGTTGEYTGSFPADIVGGQEVTDYLGATKIAPEALPEGNDSKMVSVFDTTTQTWSQVENHVGEEGYINREWTQIKELGSLPEGFTHDLPEIEKTLEEKQESVRSERDRLLTACDFTQMPDSPLNESQKNAWKTYRQDLRDITTKPLFSTEPESVIFPTKP